MRFLRISLAVWLAVAATVQEARAQVLFEPITGSEGFSGASAVRVDGSGTIYATFARDRLLMILDSSGGLASVPLDGILQGDHPVTVGWLGDTLWVANARRDLVALLDGDGTLLRTFTVRLPRLEEPLRVRFLHSVQSGDRVLLSTTAPYSSLAAGDRTIDTGAGGPRLEASVGVSDLPLLLVAAEGSVLGSPAAMNARNSGMVIVPEEPGRVRRRDGIQPFGDFDLLATAPDGSSIVVVDRRVPQILDDAAYRLIRVTPEGDTLLAHTVRYEPVLMNPEWVDAWVAEQAATLNDNLEVGKAAVRAALFLPRSLPPVSRVLTDAEGWVWVGREAVPGASETPWEIFDPSGRRAHILNLPNVLRLMTVRGPTAWASDERPRIGLLYRISPEL